MTALARSTGRGRQSTEVEQLRDLREEFTSERAEGVALASLSLTAANRIHLAVAAGYPGVVLNEAGRIGVAAGRYLAQRGRR